MKKILLFFMLVLGVVVSLCGCGKPDQEEGYGLCGTDKEYLDSKYQFKTGKDGSSDQGSQDGGVDGTGTDGSSGSGNQDGAAAGDGSSSGNQDSAQDAEKIILTEDDIYIYSYECDYMSWDEKPPAYGILLIETPEQLAFAKVRYGLDYPADYNEEDYWYYDPSFIESFQKMEKEHPLEDYAYLIDYDEVGSSGYYYHADGVVIEGDSIHFKMDDKSHGREDETASDVMGGFLHMAAVPKEYTDGKTFLAVYPDPDDIEQDLDFKRFVAYDLADAKLREVYGGEPILIETPEQYEAFLEKGKNVNLKEKRTLNFNTGVDLNKVSVYIEFFTRDDDYTFVRLNDYGIENGEFKLDYEFYNNNPGGKREETTCIIEFYIPKRFLQD